MSTSILYRVFTQHIKNVRHVWTCTCDFSSKYEKEHKLYMESQQRLQQRPVKTVLEKITLISGSEILISTLPDAERLSKRRDMKLVRVIDHGLKTKRSVYRLLTGTEYHAQELAERMLQKEERCKDTSMRGEKVVMIGDTISQHDIVVHANKIRKWVQKNFHVRVIISGNSTNFEKSEQVLAQLQSLLSDDVRFVQKRTKGNDLKVQLIPPKLEKSTDSSKTSDSGS